MRIKRILTTLLIALMMFSIVAVTSFAAGEDVQNKNASFDIEVSMDSKSALSDSAVQNGDEGVTIDLTLKIVNNPGVSSIVVNLGYNKDKLALVDKHINTEVFAEDEWLFSGVLHNADNGSVEINFLTLNAEVGSSFNNCDFVTLTFKVDSSFDGEIETDDFKFTKVSITGIEDKGEYPKLDHTEKGVEFKVHHFNAVETNAPTCDTPGNASYECTKCEEKLDVETAPALGHDLVNHEAKEPNCTEIGWDAYDTCTRCDYTTYVEKDALGHDLGEWVETTKPTCTEKGVETQSCSRCDHVETRDVDAAGHNYEAVVTAPTCTADGFTTYTCSECDDTYVDDTVEKLEHNWGEWVETTAPTTTAKGENTSTCADCGATKTEEVAKLPVMTFASEEWKKGEGLTFISDAEFENFVKVTINGEELAKEHYTVSEGSTVVVLNDEYLETLEAGEYTIAIESTTGTAEATFEIASNVWWIVLIVVAAVLLCGGGAVAVVIFLRKERNAA